MQRSAAPVPNRAPGAPSHCTLESSAQRERRPRHDPRSQRCSSRAPRSFSLLQTRRRGPEGRAPWPGPRAPSGADASARFRTPRPRLPSPGGDPRRRLFIEGATLSPSWRRRRQLNILPRYGWGPGEGAGSPASARGTPGRWDTYRSVEPRGLARAQAAAGRARAAGGRARAAGG